MPASFDPKNAEPVILDLIQPATGNRYQAWFERVTFHNPRVPVGRHVTNLPDS